MEPVEAQSFPFLAMRLCSRGNSSVEPMSSLRDSGSFFALPSTPPSAAYWAKLFRPCGAGFYSFIHPCEPSTSHQYTEALAALPAVVSKGLVGLSHAVHVFFLLDGSSPAIGRVEQLIRQLVDHALLATAAAVGQDPADGQRSTAVGIDLNRDLIVGAAHATGLHFQHRLGVLHGLLEQLDGLVPAFVFQLLHGPVEDVLGGTFLAIPHHGVNELVDQRGLIDRVRQGFTLRDMSFSRHKSSKPSAAWLRTWSDSACGWRRLRNPACRAPRDSERPADLSRGPRGSAQSSAPAGCGRHREYRSLPRCRWSA